MLRPDYKPVRPVNLLCPATATGGRALELIDRVGNLEPRKSAHVTTRSAPQRSMLEAVLARKETAEASGAPIFRRPYDAGVQQARVAGQLVHSQAPRPAG